MSKIAVIYWSGTGNTQAMAEAVLSSAKQAGSQTVMLTASEFNTSMLPTFDGIAFGCPAIGSEMLGEEEFESMFSACEPALKDKKIALFDSYGWGDGEWMRNWEETCISDGVKLVCDSVICNDTPDNEALAACKALGAALCK